MAGQLLDLRERRAVLQGVGNRCLAQGMHPDAATADSVGVDPGLARILLDDGPERLPGDVGADQALAVLRERPEQRPVEIVLSTMSMCWMH